MSKKCDYNSSKTCDQLDCSDCIGKKLSSGAINRLVDTMEDFIDRHNYICAKHGIARSYDEKN